MEKTTFKEYVEKAIYPTLKKRVKVFVKANNVRYVENMADHLNSLNFSKKNEDLLKDIFLKKNRYAPFFAETQIFQRIALKIILNSWWFSAKKNTGMFQNMLSKNFSMIDEIELIFVEALCKKKLLPEALAWYLGNKPYYQWHDSFGMLSPTMCCVNEQCLCAEAIEKIQKDGYPKLWDILIK